jgi:ribosome recycling factor
MENPWIEYERRKKQILALAKSCEEYKEALRQLLEELKL